MEFLLKPGKLTLRDISQLMNEETTIILDPQALTKIHAAEKFVKEIVAANKQVYGINTGFGALSMNKIPIEDIVSLQKKLVLSHAAGVGDDLPCEIVRLILLLKINSLACGYSGVRKSMIDALILLFNKKIYPCIPQQGSVGASGDLAPSAHLSIILLGIGHAFYNGSKITAKKALDLVGLQPLILAPKEGLALLNGTQVSTALALYGLLMLDKIFTGALISGALSTDAAQGSDVPFDERIHLARGHQGQIIVAQILRRLLAGSHIRSSHLTCNKVQDPYSLRCQPQVMGACLQQIKNAAEVILVEANSISDNPILFVEDHEVLSGGNFHAAPIAFAADNLALAITEIGSIAERRIALLIDPQFSGLPAFLVKQAGLNSGFMVAQVTAASLVSENKCLAHPASVDSIPTSANQEDHVSMATHAAARLIKMTENTITVIAIELLAACQGIDLLKPKKTSPLLQRVHSLVREQVLFYEEDRFFAPDIEQSKIILKREAFNEITEFFLLD